MRPTRLWALLLAATAAVPAAAQPILLENARVFDGRRDLGITPVLIDGERIVHVGTPLPAAATAARRIDYQGKTLLPGLVSNHAHVGNTEGLQHGDRYYTRDNVVRDLRQFQRYGITTVTALGMNGPAFFDIRKEVNASPTLGAQLYGAGAGIGAYAGAPPAAAMGLARDPVARPRNAEEARAAVATQQADGVDVIKLWVDSLGGKFPMMAPEIYRAAIAEAHARGLKVAAHIHDLDQARDLVDARVDIIAHGIRDRAVDPMLARKMHDQGTWYIATVNIDEANYWYAENPQALQQPFLRDALPAAVRARWQQPQWQREQLAGANIPGARAAVAMNLENLRRLSAAKVKFGFGTDAGAMPQRVIGFAEHRELKLLTEAGFSPAQALQTATADAAALLGMDDRGRIAAGKRADLLVLDADPLADISNTQHIHAVWQAGHAIER
ncbi:amidohydrolase family protein [Stenotrophomonas sp. S48]|uniref:amidohydrolase family protein n=1 Tax=unclassified Stenotrophomonas TaxID=196198 RepID=UPI001901AC5A|nr:MULTISPECIES: amidohydrolase family protein [unclassified Stenotrophomonas]MBK0025058.1 amidohydrolase family protein [Stenotrophomonas sp. S48]MBK0047917.1 amidohydrolase family protein [Stenotrophomonas sp. S49]